MNARTTAPLSGTLNPDIIAASARDVIATEAAAIAALESRISTEFVEACRLILACKGRVVVSGMGKSGHIARKIAATLASTGTPAFFVHPGEASHGDLGMIMPQDVVLALSYSGETDELLVILPVIKRQGIPLIVITGKAESSLARLANVCLRSVPARAGANHQHHGGAGARRCAGHCLAGSTRIHLGRLCPLASGRRTRSPAAAAHQ